MLYKREDKILYKAVFSLMLKTDKIPRSTECSNSKRLFERSAESVTQQQI